VFMYRKNAVCDQSLESGGLASNATGSKQGLPARSSKVRETAGTKNISSTKDGSSTKSADRGQLAGGDLQSKASVLKSRLGPDNSEILTTDKLYYSSAITSPEHEFVDGTEVLGNWLTRCDMSFRYFPSVS